ncbi:MAG TPA: hypothetical protein VFN68_08310 [Acidimicrobiales bacterium]|nr:hypothetical protein [Acidimicrobiales bacterium]
MKVRHPELVLAAATAVCLPMVPGLLSGQINGSAAAERFLLALLGCWILGSMLSWVMTTYSEQSRRAHMTRVLQGGRQERRAPAAVAPDEKTD